jgi:hypothetical protein
MGNPGPVFGLRAVEFRNPQVVGQGHLKGVLMQGQHRMDAIAFQYADRGSWVGEGAVDVALRIERNEFQGRSSLQARLVGLSPAGGSG